ncbi:HAD family hydrolase [Evansella cellulosilytica]|uniref:Haloacid dehalogenase domain protein hydrolase n=1 Tax=Evansella cellulosilytica (strain ATCC 21833 / DSM 2522 / FERM P-1141 / JCM 9156 / N-4) TaxID=649639 RepID=E6TYH6_EVAC2|nr:HAD family hydrolase [Evansella cellulosilytica]ADU28914.1 Haloacid dehalogenase domain protein hydrolase [Evansella cellulosilytica DSM 2522]
MVKYTTILFDLDGTISDPKIGITKSVQYALEKLGVIESDLDKLECFIGPPLKESFSDFYGFDEKTVNKAIAYYRERFKEKGMFENELYDGIPELLTKLKEQQCTLIVATSKPTVFAKEILNFFQIEKYFELVVGSHLDGSRSSKSEIITYILEKYPKRSHKHFVMIGDRKHDIIGANITRIDSIGVAYGYGSRDELERVEASYIVDDVNQLKTLLL